LEFSHVLLLRRTVSRKRSQFFQMFVDRGSSLLVRLQIPVAARNQKAAHTGLGVLQSRPRFGELIDNRVGSDDFLVVANDVVERSAREPRAADDDNQQKNQPGGELP